MSQSIIVVVINSPTEPISKLLTKSELPKASGHQTETVSKPQMCSMCCTRLQWWSTLRVAAHLITTPHAPRRQQLQAVQAAKAAAAPH
jgi:hypothetical protein